MAEAAEAVARLRLDATGFDKQANASFREFSKQLTSVKDATDAAMRGAEALQKVFVKSLGGTIAIGAANALGDAMRDVGNKIGAAAQQAADAQAGMKGLASSFEEGAARAEKLNAAAANVVRTLEELRNSGPVQAAIFRAFGGDQTLTDLQESLQGQAAAETMAGAQRGRDRARSTAGMTADQVKDFDLRASRKAQLDAADRLPDGYRQRTKRYLQEQFDAQDAAREAAAQDASWMAADREDAARSEKDRIRQVNRDVEETQRSRQSERDRAEFQAGLRRAAEQAEAEAQDRSYRRADEISQAEKTLAEVEERRQAAQRQVVAADAVASRITAGLFGSSRGPGQRMTSTEIGMNRAEARASAAETRRQAQAYEKSIRDELKAAGKSSSRFDVNRELQRRREEGARQEAKAPFDAATAAREQLAEVLNYMKSVQDVLNELKTYAHAA